MRVENKQVLFSLQPNLEAMTVWCNQNDVNGFYMFTEDTMYPESDFLARSFNPRLGNDKDIATGVAAMALAFLAHEKDKLRNTFIIEQRYNLGKPSKLYIGLDENQIWISGTVFKEGTC